MVLIVLEGRKACIFNECRYNKGGVKDEEKELDPFLYFTRSEYDMGRRILDPFCDKVRKFVEFGSPKMLTLNSFVYKHFE